MSHSLTIPVVNRKDYTISLEQFDAYTFAHCTVRRWNHTVFHAIRGDINRLLALHGGPLYAINTDDPRMVKFIRLFGFEPVGDARAIDGSPRTLYRKDKDPWAS